ncbi:C6 zinc finger protein [Beauveria brongniartii RCEF 3172]|uniref:C6 zinc finger protein n=1 Tax=Beauveria brongniartii RCEF 3172 TaxID=1081107 RepID=A0A167FWC5_9HYPO|nr:C6 zinc finger protein [Beauveria brongniartii RCEF 3172]
MGITTTSQTPKLIPVFSTQCDEESSGCGNCVKFGVPCDFLPLLERKRWATTTATTSSTTTRQQQVTKRRRGRPRADWSDWALRVDDEALSSSSSSSSPSSSSSSSSSNQLQTQPSQPAPLHTQPKLQLAELGVDDLELLHHYHTVTAPTLGDARLWRDAVPRLGREHPCIFHIMLSLSAYHVVRLRPATTTTNAADCRRRRLAEHHYEAAVRLAVPMLPRLDVGNCQALYIVTVLICFTAFARGPSSEGDLLLVAQQPGLVPWMSLLRGVRFVLKTVGSSTVFSGFLTPVPETTPDEASCRGGGGGGGGGGACRSGCGGFSARREWNWRETLGRIQDLAAKRKTCSDADADATTAKMYEGAIESLTRCFETTFGEEKEDAAVPKKCTHGQVHVVMAWAYTLDPDFVAKLAERDHVSLVLLGHFAILVQTLGRYWFIAGWGEHILRQVRQILGENWDDLLS